MKNLLATLTKLSLCLALVAGCSKQSGFELTEDPSDSRGGLGGETPLPPDELYQNVDLEGKVSGGNYDQHLAIRLDKQNNTIILMLPLGLNPFVGLIQGHIPELQGAHFTTVQDDRGQIYLALTVPLSHIIKGGKFSDNVSKLPNGDPLPAVAGGELPSTAINIQNNDKVKAHLYLGKNVLGVFVTSPFNPYIALTQPIKNKAKTKIIGYFSTVPEKGGFDGGFFMTFVMPPEIAKFLDDHLIED